ncbi:MAG: GNAT family N-acetyltransferase [Chloroflexota bacterium]
MQAVQTPNLRLRPMEQADWPAVAELVYLSTNYWYVSHGLSEIFSGDPMSAMLFCEVYEALDPGCCIMAVHPETDRLMGSCFYHPRETHFSLGIMNVHPNYFGMGVARQLLNFIIEQADAAQKPIRLVSSAMNLDSFSLYTRAGFVPRVTYQDMFIEVPESGFNQEIEGKEHVRPATLTDVPKIVALEMELSHISREKDHRYFVENQAGIWHVSVYENDAGELDGFLVSVADPGSNMIGPGAARTQAQAAALIHAELNVNRGRSPVFLVPMDCAELVQTLYAWGAKNCETHVHQVRGEFKPFTGVVMPTFMPETA